METQAKVVIIGGGVVGCSILFHLAKFGLKDCILLERNELTSGSSWHAAGNVHVISSDPNISRLMAYTINLYKEIEETSGHSVGMKQHGGFIPGIRPGKKTADYIDNILSRVTLPGSFALALVAIFPYILMKSMDVGYDLASFFGGTSLLIIVGVALDTLQQIESHLMSRHYDGFLTKGKIRGRRRA